VSLTAAAVTVAGSPAAAVPAGPGTAARSLPHCVRAATRPLVDGLSAAIGGLGRLVNCVADRTAGVVSGLVSEAALSPPSPLPTSLPAERTFHLAMTPLAYAATDESKDAIYDVLDDHVDVVCHHFDGGVPWPEALAGSPYHENVLADIERRLTRTAPEKKIYLALTPIASLRDGLAGYWAEDSNRPRPGDWADRDFDSPEVIQAYTNYCRYMIDRFHPEYVAYGVEVNLLKKQNPAAFDKYLALVRQVYPVLRKEYPELPLFLSLHVDTFREDPETQRAAIEQLLPYTDYIAVSTYPYTGHADPANIPADWFSGLANLAPEKPFAVAETGFIAERLIIDAMGVDIPGTAEWQDQYLQFLTSECRRLNARFAVWFVPRDYDSLWEYWEPFDPPQWIKLWKDTGLLDGAGDPRPSLGTWDAWRALPVAPALGTRLVPLSASCRQGDSPAPLTFGVGNTGGGTLSYEVTDDADWMSVSPGTGSCTSERDVLTVTFDAAGLPAGTYTGTVTVSAAGAVGSPCSFEVALEVTKRSGGGGGGGGCALAAGPNSAACGVAWTLPYAAMLIAWLIGRRFGRGSRRN
jgi:hypothetical protein